jgi:hypothetical protein
MIIPINLGANGIFTNFDQVIFHLGLSFFSVRWQNFAHMGSTHSLLVEISGCSFSPGSLGAYQE